MRGGVGERRREGERGEELNGGELEGDELTRGRGYGMQRMRG